MSHYRINQLLIFLSFLIPFFIYLSTMAPTVSLWDCGEFIATSIILGIPHPPGTPLYLIIGNFFSQIPIFDDMGARINFVSVITSAFTVMFLYMIIVYILEEFNHQTDKLGKMTKIYFPSFIASMTFAFTDAHWFNAVEAEVYALSTFFTAIIIWLILKWSKEKNSSQGIKYIILISYLVGLAIGIHLLNLLAIPFIALIVFFKIFQIEKNDFVKNVLIFSSLPILFIIHKLEYIDYPLYIVISFLILGMVLLDLLGFFSKKNINKNLLYLASSLILIFVIIYKGIIKGLPAIAYQLNDLTFVVFFCVFVFFCTAIYVFPIFKTYIQENIKITIMTMFCSTLLFITLNDILIKNNEEILLDKLTDYHGYMNSIMNDVDKMMYDFEVTTIEELWGEIFQLPNNASIAHHSRKMTDISFKYGLAQWVGSNIESDMKQNNQQPISYTELLKKQKLETIIGMFVLLIITILGINVGYKRNKSLFDLISKIGLTCIVMILIGYSTYILIFIRGDQNPKINYNNPHDIKSAYQYINRDQYGSLDSFDRRYSLLNNTQNNEHSWKRYTEDKKHVSSKEMRNFVWNYQIKEMYLRYLGWQFIGKENYNNQTLNRTQLNTTNIVNMPLQNIDWNRYIIPLAFLLGVLGMVWHFKNDWRRASATLALFLATGLMIILYLNQSDPQPRERDYAYVGSFFAFSIWIGIGINQIINIFEKFITKNMNLSSTRKSLFNFIILFLVFVSMPCMMLIKDYKEHNRSLRFEAWDYAYNLLNSCEPNGILFTNGDNDTFPLWYLQEVEKIRNDVKVVNLSLLNFDSYIRQLDEHNPPLGIFNLGECSIAEIKNKYSCEKENGKWTKNNKIDAFLEIIESENERQLYDYALQNWLRPIDMEKDTWNIDIKTDKFNFLWEFDKGQYGFAKTNLVIMKIIESCFGTFPIYFSTTTGLNNLGLDDYFIQEGLVYKLVAAKNYTPMDIKMNIDKTLKMTKRANDTNIIRTKEDFQKQWEIINNESAEGIYRYTNLDNSDVYYGPHIQRLSANYRNLFYTIAQNSLKNTDSLNIKYENFNESTIYNDIDKLKPMIDDCFNVLNSSFAYFPIHILPTDYGYLNELLKISEHLRRNIILDYASRKGLHEPLDSIQYNILYGIADSVDKIIGNRLENTLIHYENNNINKTYDKFYNQR